jgi:hypothetical protein
MKLFKKTFNPNLIRINRSFSVPEISGLLGVNRFTVLTWHKKEGLRAIDDRTPYMFHGKDLRKFIRERQEKRKQKCAPNEFFCFKCRQPRASANNLVIIVINNLRQLNIQGTCAVCNSKMNRRNTTGNLPQLTKIYCIEEMQNKHLLDSLSPIVITNLKGDTTDGEIYERPDTI